MQGTLFTLLVIFGALVCGADVLKKIGVTTGRFKKWYTFLFVEKYDQIHFILLILVFAAYFISRIYKLTEIPLGLHADEAGLSYDAWSLATFGVDRYMYRFPVYCINFGGGQNVLYTYLLAGLIKIFGLSIVMIRLPAVFMGAVFLIFGYLFAFRLMNSRKYALLVAALIVVSPYFLMSERWGMESALMVDMYTVAAYLFLRALQTEKMRYYILAGLTFGIGLYSYAISYIVFPVFLFFSALYCMWTGKFRWKKWMAMGAALLIPATPLILEMLTNMGVIGEIKNAVVSFPRFSDFRTDELSFGNVKINWRELWKIIFVTDGFYNNAIPLYGTVLRFTIPFSIYGFLLCGKDALTSIRKRQMNLEFICVWIFMSEILVGMIISVPIITRMTGIYYVLIYFSVYALRSISMDFPVIKPVFLVTLVFATAFFMRYYFHDYMKDYSPLVLYNNTLGDTSRYVTSEYDVMNQNIYFETADVEHPEIYIALYNGISPNLYSESFRQNRCRQIGNYYMYLPEQIDKAGVYVLKKDRRFADRLTRDGFSYVQKDDYYIFSRSQNRLASK